MSLYYKIKRNLFPVENGITGFNAQFRLEGRSRDANSEAGLEMRIADPLWMLGRQWQFGEFKGEDNGSPINITANYRKERADRYTFPGMQAQQELGGVPLEARVEAMAVAPKDLRSSVRVGQKFEKLIREAFSATESTNYITQLRTTFPLTADQDQLDQRTRSFFHLMEGNVIDGGALWEKIQTKEFPKNEFAPLASVTTALKNWYDALYLPTGEQSAWQSQNLSHQFDIHGEENIHLHAPDYQSGHLDWYSFDQATIGIDPTQEATDSKAFMPVRVSFAAMPDRRLFSFEDSKLELTGMAVD